MGVQDALYYALFTNPVSSGAASLTRSAVSSAVGYLGGQPKIEVRMAPPVPLWKLAMATGPYVRLAALSGATAVALGAYGSHRSYPKYKEEEHKQIFETASRYHFIHTLALLGLPMCRAPFLAATFFLSGITMFCGSCYYYAFTGDKRVTQVTPIGGICFIIGWLSMCL